MRLAVDIRIGGHEWRRAVEPASASLGSAGVRSGMSPEVRLIAVPEHGSTTGCWHILYWMLAASAKLVGMLVGQMKEA